MRCRSVCPVVCYEMVCVGVLVLHDGRRFNWLRLVRLARFRYIGCYFTESSAAGLADRPTSAFCDVAFARAERISTLLQCNIRSGWSETSSIASSPRLGVGQPKFY